MSDSKNKKNSKSRNVYVGHGTYKNVSWADHHVDIASKKPILQGEEHNLGLDDTDNNRISESINSGKVSPFIIGRSFSMNLPFDFTVILHCWYFLLIVMSLVALGTMFLSAGGVSRDDSSYVPLFNCVLNQTILTNGHANTSVLVSSTVNYEDHKKELLLGYSIFPSIIVISMLVTGFIKSYLEEHISSRAVNISTSIINVFLWMIILIFEILTIHYAISFYCYSHFFGALVGLSIAMALPVISAIIVLLMGCLRFMCDPNNCRNHNEYAAIP